ncbi:MAG: hypothetical protein WDN31_22380 [Hyphomicrobium sp.]
MKLAKVIEGAGENLTMLETSLASSVGSLETAVGGRTEQLQNVLENYTTALSGALGTRTEQLQTTFDSQLLQLDSSLANRTENLQTVFEEYARALDAALANRAQALDYQLVERTRSLDEAFGERLRLFDESIMRSTQAIDTAVVDKTQSPHQRARCARDQLPRDDRQAGRRSRRCADARHQLGAARVGEHLAPVHQGDGGARQPVGAAEEHLGKPADADRRHHGSFREPGPADHEAANALETANFKIDKTLQNRHTELSHTLDRLAGKADEFSSFVGDYSTSIAGSLSDADQRARSELERMRASATAESERTLEDLRGRLNVVSSAVTSELGSLTNRFTETSEEMRPAGFAHRVRDRCRAGTSAQRHGAPADCRAGELGGHAPRAARSDQGARPAFAAGGAHSRAARRDNVAIAARRDDCAITAATPQPAAGPGALAHLALLDHRAGAGQSPAPARRRLSRCARGMVARRSSRAGLTRRGRPRASGTRASTRGSTRGRGGIQPRTSKPSLARSIPPRRRRSGRVSAPASAASWCAASMATRAACCSTT